MTTTTETHQLTIARAIAYEIERHTGEPGWATESMMGGTPATSYRWCPVTMGHFVAMHGSPGWIVTDEQLDAVHDGADHLVGCAP